MMKRIVFCICALLPLANCFISGAQTLSEIGKEVKVENEILDYLYDLSNISKSLERADTRVLLQKVNKDLANQDLRFDAYYSAHLSEFADDAAIMTAVASYNEMRSALDETLAGKTAYVNAVEAIADAKVSMSEADSTYAKFVKKAKRYSMAKQSAKLLENVKAKEKMTFAKVQKKYEAAVSAAGDIPELEGDVALIEEKFSAISVNSELIQGMKFKPLVERVKDWLMSFAAVAILLMFANMMQARISAIKKEKENLKKIQEALNKNDQDIPSI